MEEVIEEGYIGNKEPLKIDENKKNIIEKQKKTCICQILIEKINEQGKNEKKKGTGFFCKIPYKGEMIPVLIMYHLYFCHLIYLYPNNFLAFLIFYKLLLCSFNLFFILLILLLDILYIAFIEF